MPSTEVPAIEHKSEGTSSDAWRRGAFMLFFMFLFGVAQSLLFVTAVVQFFWLLFAKQPNSLLLHFGSSLVAWLSGAAKFLICASESKPFPFADWPQSG